MQVGWSLLWQFTGASLFRVFVLQKTRLVYLQTRLLCWRREDLERHFERPVFRAGTILTISLLQQMFLSGLEANFLIFRGFDTNAFTI